MWSPSGRFDNPASTTTKLTSTLSLKVSNTLRHLNLPVEGFQTTDTITAIALVAEF